MNWKISKETQLKILLFLFRINLAWVFLHAFIDKAFGISKGWESAWFNGGSPTTGYLSGATGIFKYMAGSSIVDFLFMFGLFAIGTALLLGITKNLATIGGITMMALMWLAKPPIAAAGVTFWSNSLGFLMIDHHVVYSLMFLLLYYLNANEKFGLGKWWTSLKIVQKYKILE